MKRILTSLLLLFLLQYMNAFGQNTPGWALQVLSWDINKAYPGVEYDYRLGVRGGTYPYTFTLLEGPQGMSLDSQKGIITWTPQTESTGNLVKISIIDSKGLSLEHQFTIDVTQGDFRFVASNGSDAADGTEANPWATITHAIETATNSRYVYVKAGTYPVADAIDANECGKFLAYPGDSVTLLGTTATSKAQMWLKGSGNYIFQGFNCDAGNVRWFFSANTNFLENMIIRKNNMYNVYSNDTENPAFLFFYDGSQKPMDGQEHYKNIVIQENIFHDLENPNNHGSSVTMYDVQDCLYEDNVAYDIDGDGFIDKDDGYRNTIRNNIVYDCIYGICLFSQSTQGSIEVNHNLIYRCKTGMLVVGNNGVFKDIFVHHNTIVGLISFGYFMSDALKCSNINLYKNIIGDGKKAPYTLYPAKIYESGSTTVFHWGDPTYVSDKTDNILRTDSNLLWAPSTSSITSDPTLSLATWQSALFDLASVVANPGLDASYALSPESIYYGIYGRDYNQKTTSIKSVKYNKELSVRLFPNPAGSTLSVSLGQGAGSQGSIELYTLQGKKVYQTSQEVSFPHQIDVSSVASGDYLLKVVSGGKSLTQKVIIN